MNKKAEIVLGLLRLLMGWLMFWAFIDKLFGLGFATKPEDSWVSGGSPTLGFLKFAAKGPLKDLFNTLAGNPFIDWLFMMGLLLIGLAMLLGIGVRIAGFSGFIFMILLYLAGSIFPENNPFLDQHIIYALVFLLLTSSGSGKFLGLGEWWSRTKLVEKYKLLG